ESASRRERALSVCNPRANRGVIVAGFKGWPLAAIVVACWLLWTGSTDHNDLTRYQLTGYAQGTTYAVTYYAHDQKVSKVSVDSILSVIDSSMSLYKPYSLINKVNDADSAVQVTDEHF